MWRVHTTTSLFHNLKKWHNTDIFVFCLIFPFYLLTFYLLPFLYQVKCWIDQTRWAIWVTQLLVNSHTALYTVKKLSGLKNPVFPRSGQCEKKAHIIDLCVLLPSSLKRLCKPKILDYLSNTFSKKLAMIPHRLFKNIQIIWYIFFYCKKAHTLNLRAWRN